MPTCRRSAWTTIGWTQGSAAGQPPIVRCHDVAVRDGVAYVGRTAGLAILDVADPARPKQLGRLPLPASVLGVTLREHLGFLAAGAHGMYIADLSDPSAPELLQRFDTPGKVRQNHGDPPVRL